MYFLHFCVRSHTLTTPNPATNGTSSTPRVTKCRTLPSISYHHGWLLWSHLQFKKNRRENRASGSFALRPATGADVSSRQTLSRAESSGVGWSHIYYWNVCVHDNAGCCVAHFYDSTKSGKNTAQRAHAFD